MKTNDFPRLLSDFLLKELPVVRNKSSNTIASYRDCYIKLISYCNDVLGIKPDKLQIRDLTADTIVEFLNWLEENGNSISTRNQRLAAIDSLFRYIQIQSPEYMLHCQKIFAIPFKKAPKKLVKYLSEDETKELLSKPDVTLKKGRRDQVLLALLYDSGARVQELADIQVRDVRLDFPAQIKLTGKGRKTRSVPIMDKTVVLLKRYLEENDLNGVSMYEHPLFFNAQGKKLTRQGITYILKKYTDACNLEQVSPHKMRHTKAMHLTEAGVNPFYIRDFLGHEDLKVTGIYAKTSIKMKKEALEKVGAGKTIIPENQVRDWTKDKSLMDWLNGLKI